MIRTVNVTEGLKENGILIANSTRSPSELKEELKLKGPVYVVDATKIALEIFKRPFFNTPMLGALVKVTRVVSLESIERAVRDRFKGDIAEKNIQAIRRAYDEVRGE